MIQRKCETRVFQSAQRQPFLSTWCRCSIFGRRLPFPNTVKQKSWTWRGELKREWLSEESLAANLFSRRIELPIKRVLKWMNESSREVFFTCGENASLINYSAYVMLKNRSTLCAYVAFWWSKWVLMNGVRHFFWIFLGFRAALSLINLVLREKLSRGASMEIRTYAPLLLQLSRFSLLWERKMYRRADGINDSFVSTHWA